MTSKPLAAGTVIGKGLVNEGLFSTEGLPKGHGIHLAHYSENDLQSVRSWFTLQVGKGKHLVDDTIRRLNHSCDPTVRLEVEGYNVFAYALVDIPPGGELTFNYMTMDEGQAQGGMECLCGSPNCFGVLNGWDGLSDEQKESLVPIIGGYIKEKYLLPKAIEEAHQIMSDGTSELCVPQIQAGNCTCCKFTFGNWIGLVPGEMGHLEKGDTSGWEKKLDAPVDGIVCTRDPSGCVTDKPLDCKMYPFFPHLIVDDGNSYVVFMGAGDQKCAGKAALIEGLKHRAIDKHSSQPWADHLYRVARAGCVLFEAGQADWMRKTYRDYVGYSRGYFAIVQKEDVHV